MGISKYEPHLRLVKKAIGSWYLAPTGDESTALHLIAVTEDLIKAIEGSDDLD